MRIASQTAVCPSITRRTFYSPLHSIWSCDNTTKTNDFILLRTTIMSSAYTMSTKDFNYVTHHWRLLWYQSSPINWIITAYIPGASTNIEAEPSELLYCHIEGFIRLSLGRHYILGVNAWRLTCFITVMSSSRRRAKCATTLLTRRQDISSSSPAVLGHSQRQMCCEWWRGFCNFV